jgi:Ca2+-binding EF-hand superfamily protein
MMNSARILFSWNTSRRTQSFAAVLASLALCGCATNNKPQPSATAQTGTDTFASVDNNHDGKLSQSEAGDFVVYKVFEVYDSNHDGRLTLVEWTKGDPSRTNDFKTRDANRDDVVTLEEAIVYGHLGGGGVSLVRKADKNRDGKLDRAEIRALNTER